MAGRADDAIAAVLAADRGAVATDAANAAFRLPVERAHGGGVDGTVASGSANASSSRAPARRPRFAASSSTARSARPRLPARR